jgi:indolepyruvate ferredoxin oxidoreductase beta subunit
LLALEKLEAARWAYYLRPEGMAIVNNQALPPLSVSLGNTRYPSDEEIINILKQRTDHVYFVEGTQRAKELGNIRALNILMLGCVSLFMPFKVQVWKDCISQRLPTSLQQININAFNQGRKEVKGVRL